MLREYKVYHEVKDGARCNLQIKPYWWDMGYDEWLYMPKWRKALTGALVAFVFSGAPVVVAELLASAI